MVLCIEYFGEMVNNMNLYLGITVKNYIGQENKAIFWYCPERIKPLLPYEAIIEDFHLYPDESILTTEFNQKLYYDSFTEEERKNLLTNIEPDHPDHIEGIYLIKEGVEFLRNFRYPKDEARRCVDEFFSGYEIESLGKYLRERYGFHLEKLKIEFPIDNTSLQGYFRDPWHIKYLPVFQLDEDPIFPLEIAVSRISVETDRIYFRYEGYTLMEFLA